jgi:hypothetical protein
LQGVAHSLGIAGDNDKVGARRRIGLFAVLLTIASVPSGIWKRATNISWLRPKRTVNDFHLRCALHASHIVRRNGLRVGIAQSNGMALR